MNVSDEFHSETETYQETQRVQTYSEKPGDEQLFDNLSERVDVKIS